MVGAVAGPLTPLSVRHLCDTLPRDDSVHAVIIDNLGQLVPCIVNEPMGAPIGTCFVFPGGPHEPAWGGYAPVVTVLQEKGWRVVRVNTRTSGLREARFRTNRSIRFGVDDLSDALSAISELATGPVVTMGMSYGGFLASLCAEASDRSIGCVCLGGFLSPCDLRKTEHSGVAGFAQFAFEEQVNAGRRTLVKQHFVAHGGRDKRIPTSEMRSYDSPPCLYLELDSEGHGIHSDRAAQEVYPVMFNWMEELRHE